ncbi:MAG: Rieske (2Fe-2S) protein [Bacteroidota bacterium]
MNRRQFIAASCAACAAGSAMAALLEGCGVATVRASLDGSDLVVPLSAFRIAGEGEAEYRESIIVRHSLLQYPVCVYRFGAAEYSALLMRCTHQGTELQVFGDHLECPAHGSQFDNRGKVIHGPAATDLRVLPTDVSTIHLRISLR